MTRLPLILLMLALAFPAKAQMAAVAINPAYGAALAKSNVAVPLTGTTSETAMATITLPPLGPNSTLQVTTIWSMPSSANNKTLRVRLGGLSGTAFAAPVLTTNTGATLIATIGNRNSTSSQVGISVSNRQTDTLQTAGSVVTASVDTSASVTLVISGQLASGAETLTLESYTVQLIQ